MKNVKIKTAIVLMVTLLILSGCAKESDRDEKEPVPLEDVVAELYQGIDVPVYETVPLDPENFEYFTFIPYQENLSAVEADALVSITAHSLVVIHTEDGNGAELAEKVAEKADPNKWLCVRADKVSVAYTDHYVVLVMSDREMVEDVMENFKAMAKDLDGMEMQLLPGK